VIRLHPESGERVIGTLRWGLIPYWSARRLIALIGLVLVRLPLLAAAPKVFRRNPPGRSAAGK